ncbi:ankyrin repeat-containing domain protein [Aspergillus undulatus]|uniref:ankyrin repeat-containing domain protein n=1 Tax=Aspergillus undulatus TaxID=1810928 RepID=UPI003CCDF766
MGSILRPPNELLLEVGIVSGTQELGRLTCTCRRLNRLLNVHLYRRGLEIDPPALFRAAETSNEAAANRVLEHTKPSSRGLYDALAKASEKGDETIVRLLIAHGAPAGNNPRGADETPLYFAAINRHLSVVQQLLAAGASPSIFHGHVVSTIIVRCTKVDHPSGDAPSAVDGEESFDPRILRLLVEHGLEVGVNPAIVRRAIRARCSLSVIGLLLELGLNPAYPGYPVTLLRLVLRRVSRLADKHCAIFIRKCAEHGADVNHPGHQTLLHMAAMRGMPASTRALIDAGAVVDARSRRGVTPLHSAPGNGAHDDVDVLRALLDGGADLAAGGDEGKQHALMRVINQNNQPCMRLLLDEGLRLAPSVSPSELILAAAYLNDISAVQRLLGEHGDADILGARDKDENNALMVAARFRCDEVLKLLLPHSNGVDTSRNKDGDSSLHLALYSGKESTARLLMQYTSDVNMRNSSYATPLAIAVQFQSATIVRELIDRGGDIACIDFKKQSLLHHAVRRGDEAIASVLLEYNSPRTLENYAAQTPLSVGVRAQRAGIVRLSLDNGASVDERDGEGHTLLMNAVLAGSLKMAKVLIDAGADIEAKSKNAMGSIGQH